MTPTVTPCCAGSLTMDASVLVEGRTGTIEAPSIVYLIDAEETLLVDTSFGDPGLMGDRHPGYECHRTADQELDTLLANAGYGPADIDGVVLSHLDWDHCYNLDLFDADTDVYVQRRELEYAIAPYPMHAERYEAKALGREPPWLTVDLTPIEGETELCAGVTAVPTPGHTVGHQSVVVEEGDETTVVAVDAVPTFDNVTDDPSAPLRRGLAMNEFEWRESALDVLDRADRLLPGHEWGILDAEPAGL